MTAFTLGEAHFKACQHAHLFITERVLPRVQEGAAANPSGEATMFAGALLRVVAWTKSLGKLNEPSDFQAVIVASRTLFEIAVDLTLMHYDATGHPCAKLLAWEDSCKLEAARRVQDHFARRGTPPTPRYAAQVRFVATDRARIEALRVSHWGGGHPRKRWTGRHLLGDSREASRLFPAGEFEAFYETRYPEICWNTHGSGLGGVRHVRPEHFAGLSMLAFEECIRYALVCAEVSLRQFNLWGTEAEADFRRAAEARVQLMHAAMTR